MTVATLIYHMAHRKDWHRAQQRGLYRGSADDLRDGFIHFSSAQLIEASAAKHRAGQDDLLLLEVDANTLGAALRWEKSATSGTVFPHLYAPLDPKKIRRLWPLPLGKDGRHVFPKREELGNE